MQRLKEWAHRNAWLATFAEASKNRARDRAFTAHLQATVGEAVTWRRAEDSQRAARAAIDQLLAIPEPPQSKGSPSKVRVRGPYLTSLKSTLENRGATIGASELNAAARVASIDPAERASFTLYLAMLWLKEQPTIESLKALRTDRLVLHMSCVPRLDRAERSIESFAGDANRLVHLKLVGSGAQLGFDPASQLLRVPTRDSYECLPQKVFQAVSLIALACNPACMLKLDDDHRLKDANELRELLDFAARSAEPMQLGEVNRTPSPSAHHRGWHFGKCSRPELNDRMLEMPAPLKWAAGSSGYILNRGAMWRILWSEIYYRAWLEEILYEDIALAEVASKTGIRIVQVAMKRAIGAVSDY